MRKVTVAACIIGYWLMFTYAFGLVAWQASLADRLDVLHNERCTWTCTVEVTP